MSEADEIWKRVQHEIKTLPHFLWHYLRRPVEKMRVCPDWHWYTILALLIISSMVSGILAGILSGSLVNTIIGAVFLPIDSALAIAISTGFFHFLFKEILHRDVKFRALYTLIVLAALPFFAIRILYSVIPGIELLGLAASSLLLIVGIVDNFLIPRRFVIKVIGSIYGICLLVWAVNLVRRVENSRRDTTQVTPQSWKILEKEVK